MKRYFLLVLFSAIGATISRGEDIKLPKNVIMHFEKSLISLKAGTVVQVMKRDAKFITVKADGKTGTIPLDSFTPPPPEVAKPASPAPAIATTAPKVVPTPVAKPAPSGPSGGAVTNYGKMVEKARSVTDQHEKAMVSPEDGLLDKR